MLTDFTGGQSNRLVASIERAKATGREPIFYDTSGPMAHGIHYQRRRGGRTKTLWPAEVRAVLRGLSQQTVPREPHTLNDAILMAAQATTKAGKDRRRVVYVISDGKEYGSKAKTKEVIKYLQQNKIEVVATLGGETPVSRGWDLSIPFTFRS